MTTAILENNAGKSSYTFTSSILYFAKQFLIYPTIHTIVIHCISRSQIRMRCDMSFLPLGSTPGWLCGMETAHPKNYADHYLQFCAQYLFRIFHRRERHSHHVLLHVQIKSPLLKICLPKSTKVTSSNDRIGVIPLSLNSFSNEH